MDRWRDETIAWWGGERVRLAFLVAPLVGPVIPILLFGVPVYRFLCSRHLTAFWVAPIAGFVAGTGAALFFYLLMEIGLGSYSSLDKLTLDGLLLGTFVFGGLFGVPIATVVWLIARPDRVVT